MTAQSDQLADLVGIGGKADGLGERVPAAVVVAIGPAVAGRREQVTSAE